MVNGSVISNFAFSIFSLEPKLPICAVPILVITAIVGFTIFVNIDNSPKWFIPISVTSTSSSFSFNIVRGNPIWLFSFPSVFRVLYFVFTTSYIISLVLVFPTDPVTAITGILYLLLLYLANSCIHLIVSSTFIIVLSLYSDKSMFSSILSNMQQAAPLFSASL